MKKENNKTPIDLIYQDEKIMEINEEISKTMRLSLYYLGKEKKEAEKKLAKLRQDLLKRMAELQNT